MAKNLVAKMEPTDKLIVYDRNTDSTSKFQHEVGVAASSTDAGDQATNVEVASSVREAAEMSVRASSELSPHTTITRDLPFHDEFDILTP